MAKEIGWKPQRVSLDINILWILPVHVMYLHTYYIQKSKYGIRCVVTEDCNIGNIILPHRIICHTINPLHRFNLIENVIFRFVVRQLLPDIFNNTRLLLYIHDDKTQYLTEIINERLSHYEDRLKLKPPIPTLPCTFTNSILFVSTIFVKLQKRCNLQTLL